MPGTHTRPDTAMPGTLDSSRVLLDQNRHAEGNKEIVLERILHQTLECFIGPEKDRILVTQSS